MGADNYLGKPFEPSELLARIQAVLGRYERPETDRYGSVIIVGETFLDLGDLAFTDRTRRLVVLTPTERKLLGCLMRNANLVVSRSVLIERTWTYDDDCANNRIDIYNWRWREKIEVNPPEPSRIHSTRHGLSVPRPSTHQLTGDGVSGAALRG